jgi:hypothetical protein
VPRSVPTLLLNGRPEHRLDLREMAMNNKLMFVAVGYVLLLAVLGFALDLSIAAMIVS